MTTQLPVTRRLFVSMMVSLDGYIEGPNRELDWPADRNDAFNHYTNEMVDAVDLAVFGRRSYEMMVRYWPDAEAHPKTPWDLAFARKMNAMPKLVLSRTLERATWNNTRVVKDRVAETLTDLKQQAGKSIAVWGGAGVIASLAALDLIDEYRLIVHPLLLGGGTSLFAPREARTPLRLVRTSTLGADLAVLCYEPVRA